MKRTNTIVLLLIVSLILVSFNYTTGNDRNEMLTRHDKDEAEFLKLAKQFEKYMCHINLPDCEGTMIAEQWAITASHCAVVIVNKFNKGRKHFVIINDVEVEVDKVIMYKEWEESQVEQTLSNVDTSNDIALLRLKNAPSEVLQAKLYENEDEKDQLIYMVGKGDKGNGLVGVDGNDGKQRGATNRIETAIGNWLTWTFDHPNTKTKYLTEYEGISGPGDSGGPAFIVKDDTVYLAGISSWQDTKDGDEGLYGVVENFTRVSQYVQWIHDEMKGNKTTSEEILRVAPLPNATVYKPKAIYVSPGTFKQYVGEYKLQNRVIRIYTKENDEKLYFDLTGFPVFEFIATAEHHFSSVIMEGFMLEFKNLENGAFKEVTIIQPEPDGALKAVRK